MLADIVVVFLGVSLLFYCCFAGADFGAGILELFVGRHRRDEQRDLLSHAIAPIWEANHVWLILAIVILFNGFPRAYAAICTLYHIPLTLLLVGIIARGCAFTFRHYDAVVDRSAYYYSLVFQTSSVLASLTFGVCVGALAEGRVPTGGDYVNNFVWSWLSAFSLATGVLTCTLFAFLAAVYMVGESEDTELRTKEAVATTELAMRIHLVVHLGNPANKLPAWVDALMSWNVLSPGSAGAVDD